MCWFVLKSHRLSFLVPASNNNSQVQHYTLTLEFFKIINFHIQKWQLWKTISLNVCSSVDVILFLKNPAKQNQLWMNICVHLILKGIYLFACKLHVQMYHKHLSFSIIQVIISPFLNIFTQYRYSYKCIVSCQQ